MRSEHIEQAFQGKLIILPYKEKIEATFSVKEIGKLKISTGKLVACDPLVCPDSEPFTFDIPVGDYPVTLAIAQIKDDQRVAYAKLNITAQTVVKWEMALLAGQDTSMLKEDEKFGYGVDAGTACFGDKIAMEVLQKKMDEVDDYYETITDECDKSYVHTWSWCDLKIKDDSESNILIFSSGFGDGFYTTWVGYSADGEIASIATDFDVVFEDNDDDVTKDSTDKKWWQIWK
jgi:hypothetical protein